jgi:hypothetical protein
MAAWQRWPRGAHPRKRAILVESPLSSMKIRFSGASSGWLSDQRWRAAFMS